MSLLLEEPLPTSVSERKQTVCINPVPEGLIKLMSKKGQPLDTATGRSKNKLIFKELPQMTLTRSASLMKLATS